MTFNRSLAPYLHIIYIQSWVAESVQNMIVILELISAKSSTKAYLSTFSFHSTCTVAAKLSPSHIISYPRFVPIMLPRARISKLVRKSLDMFQGLQFSSSSDYLSFSLLNLNVLNKRVRLAPALNSRQRLS